MTVLPSIIGIVEMSRASAGDIHRSDTAVFVAQRILKFESPVG
jgi:hypothetical protein